MHLELHLHFVSHNCYEDILSNRVNGILSAKLMSSYPNDQSSANMVENEDTANVNLSEAKSAGNKVFHLLLTEKASFSFIYHKFQLKSRNLFFNTSIDFLRALCFVFLLERLPKSPSAESLYLSQIVETFL